MQEITIRRHLLWEYDWDTIDFERLATVVVERVIERGNIKDWKAILHFYGVQRILNIADRSTRLDQRHKRFTSIFLQSDLLR
jgi:hypothetical protein